MLKTGVKDGPNKGKSFYVCVEKQGCDFSQLARYLHHFFSCQTTIERVSKVRVDPTAYHSSDMDCRFSISSIGSHTKSALGGPTQICPTIYYMKVELH